MKNKINIKTISDASKPVNEDGYVNKENAFAVIDGATSLVPTKIKGYPNGAVWITKETEKYLEKNINGYQIHLDDYATPTKYMEKLILDLNIHLQTEFKKVCNNISRETEPSCGIALGKIYGNKIQLAIVGDLTILIEKTNGDIIELQDFRLKELDDYAISKMVEVAKQKGISNNEAREFINDILITNRNKKNQKDGYSVMSTDNVLLDNIINVSFDLNEISNIYAFSDGIAELYDTLDVYPNYKEFVNMLKINNYDPQIAIDKLREAQSNDNDCSKYPRFKTGDDATLSIIKIN